MTSTKRVLSRAVQERRGPAQVEADDATFALWRRLDWFATPCWATRAGAELVKRLDPLCESVWEPACGDGIMAECLKEYFPVTLASDIHPQGYGAKVDFLDPQFKPPGPEWIVTNPPFAKAIDFLKRGLEIATSGVALLCRLSFLESADRYEALYRGEYPLTVLAPFSERVAMRIGPWNPNANTATAYAWFLWRKSKPEPPNWAARVHPIPPGTRARLSKPDDIRRFCRETPAPLFEGDEDAADTVDA